jgi:hypothetical protein
MYRGERNVNRDRRGGPGVGPRDPASVPGKGKSPERKLVGNEYKILYSVNVLTHMIIPGSWILSYTLPERDV